jgi:lipid-A-disaccharide synthase
MAKKILVSAGDPSGDQLLAKIIKMIHEKNPGAYEFWGLAGPLSQKEGVKLLVSSKDVAVVGAVEVIKSAGKILKALGILTNALKESDSLICVDFPDFNFRLASVAKKLRKPVDYIVAPQMWAWRSGRVNSMKKWLRRLYPVLSFEEEYFKDRGIDAKFLGHPIRDALPPRNRGGARDTLGLRAEQNVLAVLPGSRRSEIKRNLPLLMEAWELFKKTCPKWGLKTQWTPVLTVAQGWDLEEIKKLLNKKQKLQFEILIASEWKLSYHSHATLMASDFGWITSGTASLEAGYYQLPHILLYKVNPLSAMILKSLSSYFSDPNAVAGLPNILLQKKIIPELIQSNLSPRRLAFDTLDLLQDPHRLDIIKKYLRWIPKKLGDHGVSARIADDLLELWSK